MPEQQELTDKLASIRQARDSIKNSLESKGQTVNTDIRTYSQTIDSMYSEIEDLAEDILGGPLQ